jgi:multidrug efflux pump subunit AcrB
MMETDSAEIGLERPGTASLRAAFFGVWFVDLVATILFFTVPYASELNPVTVFLHDLFGMVGVVLAALIYAGFVVGIGFLLSRPFDVGFVTGAVVLYAIFASNNVVLLVFREPLLAPLVS